VDVYLPGPGKQIHDLNPSAFPPVGLFWTIEIPDDDSGEQEGDHQDSGEGPGGGVEVELGRGSASMRVSNAPILDYGTLQNALFGGGPSPIPGSVSFKVVWSGDQRVNIKNTDPVYGGFEGEFIRGSAQMEWTARVGNYTFASDALATSSSSFAEIGRERNGSFFK